MFVSTGRSLACPCVRRRPSSPEVRGYDASEFALHIATEGALTRPAPSFEIPSGAVGLDIAEVFYGPVRSGRVARELLLLPRRPELVRYMLPVEIESGLGGIWRTCPTTGLELRSEAAHEAWFARWSGTSAVVTPGSLGLGFSPEAMAEAAWWVLASTPHRHDAQKMLFEAAFRLDADNSSVLSERMAGLVAARWRIGAGLCSAAAVNRCWLNPRCLRWIGRELAAAQAAVRSDIDVQVTLSVEAQFALTAMFPHVVEGRTVDASDVLMASWMLHDTYSGADDWDVEGDDVLGHLSALTYASPSSRGCIERFASAESLWAVADEDAPVGHPGWGGLAPSRLRGAFADEIGLEVHEWLGAAMCALIGPWAGALDFANGPICASLGIALPDTDLGRRAGEALDEHLVQSIDELGESVLHRSEARPGGYQGLGSTSQTEWSELHHRPVVSFDGSTMVITGADAFGRAAAAFPRKVLEGLPELGGRRRVGATLGNMFEAATAKLLRRLIGRCDVKTEVDIESILGVDGSRADLVVVDAGAVAVLELGLQPILIDAATGSSAAVQAMIDRYASKVRQAQATSGRIEMSAALSAVAGRAVGHFVVVEEPLAFTAVHCAAVRAAHPDVPDLFVVGIGDLGRLVDLAEVGHSFPQALVSWQTGGSQLPFDHRLYELEHWMDSDHSRLQSAMERLGAALFPDEFGEAA